MSKPRVCQTDVMVWIMIVIFFNFRYTLGNNYSDTRFRRRRTCVTSYSTPLAMHSGMRSELECARKCSLNTDCASFLYNQTSKHCTTNEGTLFASTSSACANPVTYAEKKSSGGELPLSTMRTFCMDSDDCTTPMGGCYHSSCGCDPGYSYNPSTDTCIEFCTAYGTTFQLDKDHLLVGFNNDVIMNSTADDCKAACVHEFSFVCRTAEFFKLNSVCYLSNGTALTEPLSYQNDTEYDFMQRDCASMGTMMDS